MDPQNKISCPLGQEFSLCGSTKVHQVQYGNIKDLVYFSGPTKQKILVLKDKNFLDHGSTKVHKLFLSHFAQPNGLWWTQKTENFGPLKSTSLFFLTLKSIILGPLKFKKTKKQKMLGPLKSMSPLTSFKIMVIFNMKIKAQSVELLLDRATVFLK